jgi:hypothetical protein
MQVNAKVTRSSFFVKTVLIWAVVWGVVSTVSVWAVNPDTSHVSSISLGVMVGLIAGILGALAGLIFKRLVVWTNVVSPYGRAALGIAVCGAVGLIARILVVQTNWAILIAVALGAVLPFLHRLSAPPSTRRITAPDYQLLRSRFFGNWLSV